jgi:hypothetical protein
VRQHLWKAFEIQIKAGTSTPHHPSFVRDMTETIADVWSRVVEKEVALGTSEAVLPVQIKIVMERMAHIVIGSSLRVPPSTGINVPRLLLGKQRLDDAAAAIASSSAVVGRPGAVRSRSSVASPWSIVRALLSISDDRVDESLDQLSQLLTRLQMAGVSASQHTRVVEMLRAVSRMNGNMMIVVLTRPGAYAAIGTDASRSVVVSMDEGSVVVME